LYEADTASFFNMATADMDVEMDLGLGELSAPDFDTMRMVGPSWASSLFLEAVPVIAGHRGVPRSQLN
jgi:hypothetical protein